MRVISPYFQHFYFLEEHDRASVEAQACMKPTWSAWMLLAEGFD